MFKSMYLHLFNRVTDALAALEARRTESRRKERPLPPPAVIGGNTEKPLLMAQSGDPDILQKALAWGADVAVYCPEDLRALDAPALPERFALAIPAVLTAEALDTLNAWARANGLVRLELTVECPNTGAKALYEKHGFTVEGVRPKSMKVNGTYVDEYYMGKILE